MITTRLVYLLSHEWVVPTNPLDPGEVIEAFEEAQKAYRVRHKMAFSDAIDKGELQIKTTETEFIIFFVTNEEEDDR